MADHYGWRSVAFLVAGVAALAIPLVALFLPESPQAIGLRMYGVPDSAPLAVDTAPKHNLFMVAIHALMRAMGMRDFWLLFVSFFVCGMSTNGYIGTQFIAMCGDYGIGAVSGAGILAAMGVLDLLGTTMSGWLTDKYDSRILLCWYYGLRGLALLFLPHAFGLGYFGLPIFAVFYGLDWIATVPPTVRLANDVFGRLAAPIVFGWIAAGHQLGAAFANFLSGTLRANLGTYTLSSMLMGAVCVGCAGLVLRINRRGGVEVAA